MKGPGLPPPSPAASPLAPPPRLQGLAPPAHAFLCPFLLVPSRSRFCCCDSQERPPCGPGSDFFPSRGPGLLRPQGSDTQCRCHNKPHKALPHPGGRPPGPVLHLQVARMLEGSPGPGWRRSQWEVRGGRGGEEKRRREGDLRRGASWAGDVQEPCAEQELEVQFYSQEPPGRGGRLGQALGQREERREGHREGRSPQGHGRGGVPAEAPSLWLSPALPLRGVAPHPPNVCTVWALVVGPSQGSQTPT